MIHSGYYEVMVYIVSLVLSFVLSLRMPENVTFSQNRKCKYSGRSPWIINLILWVFFFFHLPHQCSRDSTRSRQMSPPAFTHQGEYYWRLTLEFFRNNGSQKLIQSLIGFCQKSFSDQAVSLLRLHWDYLWWQRIKGLKQPWWLNNLRAICPLVCQGWKRPHIGEESWNTTSSLYLEITT